MLTCDGRLFHIDFGYILGSDPKPFPPPMKICREMVEAMGGQGSEYYVQFRMYACEAYNILRKSGTSGAGACAGEGWARKRGVRHPEEERYVHVLARVRWEGVEGCARAYKA
eukprot:366332-Chlamydomonas_euryale.AAC.11